MHIAINGRRHRVKAVILGNSGSGKTWLSESLTRRRPTRIVHLDNIFWQPGGFDIKRPNQEVVTLIESHLHQQEWIAEGVFGRLAEPFLQVAEELVWLDTPWEVCEERLRRRGSESKHHMDRQQSSVALVKLLTWASEYYSRTGDCSFAGHMDLYERFSRSKHRLVTAEDVVQYLDNA